MSTKERICVVPLANYSEIAKELKQILPDWEANVIQTDAFQTSSGFGVQIGMELWFNGFESLSDVQCKNLMIFMMRHGINLS